MILQPALFDSAQGTLSGEGVSRSSRKLRDLTGIFADAAALSAMDLDTLAYEVEMHDRCGEVEGGLFFGVSHLQPGKVGNEFFMTKGHFHSKRDRGEYYWGIQGQGLLVLMDEQREAWAERVFPGSLHYISGHVAHRLVNTGDSKLIVGACWPSDAGHDYASIQEHGFSVRIREENGEPIMVPVDSK